MLRTTPPLRLRSNQTGAALFAGLANGARPGQCACTRETTLEIKILDVITAAIFFARYSPVWQLGARGFYPQTFLTYFHSPAAPVSGRFRAIFSREASFSTFSTAGFQHPI